MANVGVGGWMNSQQEVADELQQIHVWRRAQHFLDDFDEGQTDLLRDGCQMFVPVLLNRNAFLVTENKKRRGEIRVKRLGLPVTLGK